MIAAALITAILIAVMILRARPVAQNEQVRILAEHVVDKVSTHDADGTFRYVSAVFAGLLGEYPGMLVGKHPRDFAHPDDVQVLAGLFRRAMQFSGTSVTAIWRCGRHSGEYAWLETTARTTANDLKKVGAIVCASRDITERKQIEDALRDSENRFRTTLETVRLVAVGLDTNGRVTFANESLCALTGWTRSELVGDNWFDRCIPANDPLRAAFFEHIASGEIPRKYEQEIMCRDGTRRRIDWDTTVLRSPTGAVLGTASLGADVTNLREEEAALKRARDEAEAANRAKSEFLSRMSHELRTPLNSVIGFANVLRKNKSGRLSSDDLTFLDRIRANGQHLLTLVNNVLDIAKVESGRLTVTTGLVAVGQLLHDVAGQLEGQPRGAGVQLHVEAPADMVPIETDGVLLRQVVINLAANALRFTHEGKVVIAADADERTGVPLRIHVRDTGIGIPRDRQEAIFEAFEQADTDTHRTYGGTGLGLSISKAICDALGYQLSVESEVGKGSTFTVCFATVSDSDRSVPKSDSETSARDQARKLETQKR